MNGHTDIVKLLIAKGAEPSSEESDAANALTITVTQAC